MSVPFCLYRWIPPLECPATIPLYEKHSAKTEYFWWSIVVQHRGVDSRLRAWSGPALTLHRSVIHSRPFDSPAPDMRKAPSQR